MKETVSEKLEEAARQAKVMAAEVQKAHSSACNGDPALEILLQELLVQAITIKARLDRLTRAYRKTEE